VKYLFLVLAACQGSSSDQPSPKPATPEAAVVVPDAAEVVDAKIEEPEPPDPGKVISDLGAIPAWQAVVDRAFLLARRGQHGVAFGRIGPAVTIPGEGLADAHPAPIATPYVWLVDDTEGNGALGIRVLLGTHAAKETDRVALAGAWMLDDAKRWYWAVDNVTALPAAEPSDIKDPPIAIPSHEITGGGLPPGAHTITVAKDNDPVYFQIVGPAPVRDGEGWLVANELGDIPFARLVLPGERPSYGGQDMRADDERWHLKRATTYWVRIGKIRKLKPDEPANINARTAPIKYQ